MELETIYDGLERKDSFTVIFYSDPNQALQCAIDRILFKENEEQSKKRSVNMRRLRSALEKRAVPVHECSTNNQAPLHMEQTNLDRENANQHADDTSEHNSSDSEHEFHLVYSSEFSTTDTETSSDTTSASSAQNKTETSASDEMSLMSGYQEFIGSCLYRKLRLADSIDMQRKAQQGNENLSVLGPEHKIMAAVTFRIRYLQKRRRVIHIIFLAVRHRWRKNRLGTMLISLLKDTLVVGPYEAIVVHADLGARAFFRRIGFTENLIVNQQWSEVADEYTNCRLMTFVPGVSQPARQLAKPLLTGQLVNQVWLKKIDQELDACVKQTEQAHCANVFCLRKMREELINLRQSMSSQVSDLLVVYLYFPCLTVSPTFHHILYLNPPIPFHCHCCCVGTMLVFKPVVNIYICVLVKQIRAIYLH
ncbi:unnamed protein product [Echinostoma caproni]|uniref:N-acetyltransferase domain-containing protein n=1 Tax=Echinostoma caproni TaxID=27848 RepID=A0A183BD53_9TREM|nr:unnamed protein product [Echinostoma caproni]